MAKFMNQKHWHLLKEETHESQDAFKYFQIRASFANSVSQEIRNLAKLARDENIPAIYAVWLNKQSNPIYIGQTQDSKRRLWDLAIGESHHLANMFPPETWGKVCIFRWKDFLENHQLAFESIKGKSMNFDNSEKEILKQIGLSIELSFQIEMQPLFNKYKRLKDGSLKAIDFSSSGSSGSKLLSQIDYEFDGLKKYWYELTSENLTGAKSSISLEYGAVVYPQNLMDQIS
ncbi:MAG: hypothetical protein ACI85U_002026 [Candidatus Promineifilaceae bacterium]|jgi:hypothetical protein